MREYISHNLKETRELSSRLARKMASKDKAVVLCLTGDLGGGKTAFVQGFAKALGIKEKILSPTFVLMKKFDIPRNKNFKKLFHFDCYRINKPKEILSLGFREIISDPQNIIVAEWAEKIKEVLPSGSMRIHFEFIDEGKRKITFYE